MQTRDIMGVIFDMDGVLTDSEPLMNAAAVATFRDLGTRVRPEDFLPFAGVGDERYLSEVAEKYGIDLDLAAAKERMYELYYELVPHELRAFPGVRQLVRLCRDMELKLAVATSADWPRTEANLRKIELPPESWDAIVSAEDAAKAIPSPEMFLAAARKLHLEAAECTVVEDTVHGVQAARSAGMRCVAVAQTVEAEKLRRAHVIRGSVAEVWLGDLLGLRRVSRTKRQSPVKRRSGAQRNSMDKSLRRSSKTIAADVKPRLLRVRKVRPATRLQPNLK